MPHNEPQHDTAAIRKRLADELDDPSLDAFCMDRYPQVYGRFSRGLRRDEKISLLLEHVHRHEELETLLTTVRAWKSTYETPREAETAAIETRYREDLVKELEWHSFRGIVQMKRDLRLPLADIYVELGLLRLGGVEERRRAQERLLALREEERLAEEERRLQERVTGALSESPRLVILGEPGSGKTISLRFIALMLAQGHGAARLGLDVPYVPLMVRLADYARALETQPSLSLGNYLLDYIGQAYECHPRLPDFLRLALERGVCMVLLDGLDEVGDDPVRGRPLRTRVVGQVQRFADHWCDDASVPPSGKGRGTDERCNRVVVTSRIEGYWDESVRGFDHVQLSPLRPPDEVETFLLRWYTPPFPNTDSPPPSYATTDPKA